MPLLVNDPADPLVQMASANSVPLSRFNAFLNSRAAHTAQIPAAKMIANARALARLYAAISRWTARICASRTQRRLGLRVYGMGLRGRPLRSMAALARRAIESQARGLVLDDPYLSRVPS
jgi:hypothetical protein